MTHEFVVENVVEILIGGDLGHPAWRVDIVKPDIGVDGHWFNGTLHNQHIPKAAMEWRMAEHDMGLEEAMDLLLHEPFMTSAMQLPEAEEDMKRISSSTMMTMKIKGIDVEKPISVYNAESVEEATRAVRTRLSVVKRRIQVVSRVDQDQRKLASTGKEQSDPLDVIRRTHNVTKNGIKEKKEYVTALRQEQGLDSHLPPAKLPARYADPQKSNPFKEDGAVQRILEQKQDPTDNMWF